MGISDPQNNLTLGVKNNIEHIKLLNPRDKGSGCVILIFDRISVSVHLFVSKFRTEKL